MGRDRRPVPHPRTLQEPVRKGRRVRGTRSAVPHQPRGLRRGGRSTRSRARRARRRPSRRSRPPWSTAGSVRRQQDGQGSPALAEPKLVASGVPRRLAAGHRLQFAELRTEHLVPPAPRGRHGSRSGNEGSPGPDGNDAPRLAHGYTFQLQLKQHGTPTGLATPQLRDTTVTLPRGCRRSRPPPRTAWRRARRNEIQPRARRPRAACPAASQIGKRHDRHRSCSKSRSQGRVYVGQPQCGFPVALARRATATQVEDGELVKLYIEVEGAGVRVKLARLGVASTSSTGQITTTFLNNPQLPFEKLTLKLKIGPRAPLASAAGLHRRLLRVRHAHAVERRRRHRHPAGEPSAGRPTPSPFEAEGPFGISPCPAEPPVRTRLQRRQRILRTPASTRTSTSRSPARTANRASPASPFTRPRACSARSQGIPRCEGLGGRIQPRERAPAASQIGTATSAVGPGSEPYVDPEGTCT